MRIFLAIASVLLVSLIFITSALVHMPAAVMWDMVSKTADLRSMPVQPQQLSGTIWDGAALAVVQQTGERVLIDWKLSVSSLLLGEEFVQTQVRTRGIDLTVGATTTASVADLNVSGSIDLDLFKPILSQNRLQVGGLVDVRNVQARYDFNNEQLLSADGNLYWPGGRVSYPVGANDQTADIPALRGDLGQTSGQPSLDLVLNDTGAKLLSAVLEPGMTLALQVRKRMLDVAGAPYSDRADADAIVFRLKQPLVRP
ncbi:MAG: hypothetical protein CME36_01455 [unclassified Hahellaceae]|nr:hypothetical protein [Hahellaceae bacterium]